MMSLIILINSLICLITGILFYFYIHQFKEDITRNRIITYFIFGAYFIFNGFFGLKLTFIEAFSIKDFNVYNNLHLFALMHLLSNVAFTVFIINSIRQEKNVSNHNNTKNSV